jgi:exodeoxyribonuclease VII large subunit
LCGAVADALSQAFNPVSVLGEISGLSSPASGHLYFSLKDANGQIRCAMFRRSASFLRFEPRNGLLVEVHGKLGVYEARGDLQLVAESMTQAGQGAYFEQFLQLKAKLQAEGLFSPERKKPLPGMPRVVGLVTSLGAAALHDVVSALKRRAPHLQVILAPAAVQGAVAITEISKSLSNLYQLCNEGIDQTGNSTNDSGPCAPDVILLVRGGGAIEDLAAFNDEALARLIAQSPVPIVTGLGHETDFTIADFVADVRAPTPTAAAELISLPRADFLQYLEAVQQRLQSSTYQIIDSRMQQLDLAVQRLGRPSLLATRQTYRLDAIEQALNLGLDKSLVSLRRNGQSLARRLLAGQAFGLSQQRNRLDRLALQLGLLDPALVLQRGYAWLQGADGQAITRVGETFAGQRIRATLSDGKVDMSVLKQEKI